jgi:hypothetical protein
MKKNIYKLLVLCAVALFGASCEESAELTTLQNVSFPSAIEASTNTIVLSKDHPSESAVAFSWPAVAYPIKAPVTYALQFTIPENTKGEKPWSTAIRVVVGEDVLSKSFLAFEINKIALQLGLPFDVAGTIVVRAESYLDHTIYSDPITLTITPFEALAHSWGVVGDGTHAPTPEDKDYGWNHSVPMNYDYVNKNWKITLDLIPGNIKFRLDDSWDVNYGAKNNTELLMYLANQGSRYIGEAGTYEVTFTIDDANAATSGYPETAAYTVTKI